MYLQGKRILVIGLGKTGKSIANELKKRNADVVEFDDKTSDHSAVDMDTVDGIAVSPGVPFSWPHMHQLINIARQKFIPMFSDLDIFLSSLNSDQRVIAITGTNGKSTTTALIYHILKENGSNVEIGGNIGNPVLELRKDADVYVLELSSYQLELTNNTHFYASVLLNITPDHLARHGGMHGYIAAKQRIFMDSDTRAVVAVDDAYCCEILDFLKLQKRDVTPISGIEIPDNGIGWYENQMMGFFQNIRNFDGQHNRQNIAAAYAIARMLDITDESFSRSVSSFRGLEHRQEIIEQNCVLFVNDSKATNADATEHAIKRFLQDDIIWIVGGLAKEGGINSLEKYFPSIKEFLLIGASSDEFAAVIGRSGQQYRCAETLDKAVDEAIRLSKGYNSPVVLFSPACASFDQFKNFEERGRAFKKLVEESF